SDSSLRRWWLVSLLPLRSARLSSIFFFQAEDGIRDATVTGVQTCALPIFVLKPLVPHLQVVVGVELPLAVEVHVDVEPLADDTRSEERRVGKECRSRLARYY